MRRSAAHCVASSAALSCCLLSGMAAAAGKASCDGPALSVRVPDEPQWAAASSRLTYYLHHADELDLCARVTVRPGATGVTLRVTTSDGREAERHIESVDELLTEAEALLALPPVKALPLQSEANLNTRKSHTATAEVASAHVELGVAGAVRVGGAPVYAGGGLAAFAEFVLERWLIAVNARVDVTDTFVKKQTRDDFQMESTAVSVNAGRRVNVGQAAVDALVGADVVLESQDADYGDREIHGAASDFRVGVTLRISGPRSASIRPFAVADFESSPSRIRNKRYIDRSLPNLPWWSGGVAVGVLWGAR